MDGGDRSVAIDFDFDDETRMRPVDDHLLAVSREEREQELFAALPSLEARPPFDTYEAQFAERDPETQLYAAVYESQRRMEVAPATERLGSVKEESGPYLRRDASVARRPPPAPVPEAYAQPIPRAPAVPRELPPKFVMGVQPIRTQNSSWQPAEASGPQPRIPMSDPSGPHRMLPYADPSAPRMPISVASSGPYAPQPAPTAFSKASRLVYFVIGTTFGICFAFFATGFVPRLLDGGEKKQVVVVPTPPPPATVLTAAPASSPQPPPVVVAPTPPAPMVIAASPAPQAPAPRAAAPSVAPKSAPRGTYAHRSTPSVGPKALPGSGSVDADDVPPPVVRSRGSSAPSAAEDDMKQLAKNADLFGAALKP